VVRRDDHKDIPVLLREIESRAGGLVDREGDS
jgi:hypothetical protein